MWLEERIGNRKARYDRLEQQKQNTGVTDLDLLRQLKNEKKQAAKKFDEVEKADLKRHEKRRVNEDRMLAKELGIPYEELVK